MRRTVTDAGTPLGVINYDPWGTPESGTVPTFGFTGEVQDVSAGLVNLRARWYSTVRGRFTSVDPFAGTMETPYSQHQYQYGYSDPVGKRDPSGKSPALCFAPLLVGPEAAPITGLCLAVVGAIALVGTAYATYEAYQCAQQSCLVRPVEDLVNRFSSNAPDSPNNTANQDPPPPYQRPPGTNPQQSQRGEGIFVFPRVGPGICITSGGFDLSPGAEAFRLPFPLNPPQGPMVFAASYGGGTVSPYTQADQQAIKQFADEGIAKYGRHAFSGYWDRMVPLIAADRPDDYLVYRVGDRITGAMLIHSGTDTLLISFLQGLGDGAGTSLIKAAVRESIARGFDGRVKLQASEYPVSTRFYENRGFVYQPGTDSVYVLTEEAAQWLLQQ